MLAAWLLSTGVSVTRISTFWAPTGPDSNLTLDDVRENEDRLMTFFTNLHNPDRCPEVKLDPGVNTNICPPHNLLSPRHKIKLVSPVRSPAGPGVDLGEARVHIGIQRNASLKVGREFENTEVTLASIRQLGLQSLPKLTHNVPSNL